MWPTQLPNARLPECLPADRAITIQCQILSICFDGVLLYRLILQL